MNLQINKSNKTVWQTDMLLYFLKIINMRMWIQEEFLYEIMFSFEVNLD